MRTSAIGIMFMLAFAPRVSAAKLEDCNMRLRLHDAVAKRTDDKTVLDLELQLRDGQLQKSFLMGRTPRMNQGRHVGCIKDGKVEDDRLKATIEVLVKPDPWVSGGSGSYDLDLRWDPDTGSINGTFKGSYSITKGPKPMAPRRGRAPERRKTPTKVPAALMKALAGKPKPATKREPEPKAEIKVLDTVAVSGKVTGTVVAPWPVKVAGHVPLQPGEHPRLIFRRSDLPMLKKRAETPEGKAIMARFMQVIDYKQHNTSHKFDSWPGIGFGFAYQMTGEQKWADRARALIEAKFFDRRPIGGQDIHHAPQAQGLALTFDLCYDGWDESFRQKCIDELWQRAQECNTGTFRGGKMGGFNLAYWSNHNGIRQAGAGLAALAVLHEKTSDGKVLEDEARAIAEEAAWDSRGWLRDGCGGGAWFMEGMFYKGMTLVRGLMHYLIAYPTALGLRIDGASMDELFIAGHFMEAEPGGLWAKHKGLKPAMGIDSDSFAELIWTMGIYTVPADMLPGVKYLMDRHVGLQGNKTFGLERASYAPYLMMNYPFELEAKPPNECFRWVSPDPVNGHWVFRPVHRDRNDILMIWNMLSHVRPSCHYERVGPALDWRLVGFGHTWFAGRYQPVVEGKESAMFDSMDTASRILDWSVNGQTASVVFDMTPGYMPKIDGKNPVMPAGALRKVREDDFTGLRADMGITGQRHVVVDCSGESGAALLMAISEDLKDRKAADAEPVPALVTWRLPMALKGAQVSVDGNRFTVAKGDAALAGVVLGGGAVDPADCSVRTESGRVLAVIALQKGEKPVFEIEGAGMDARVTLGQRSVRLVDGRLVLE